MNSWRVLLIILIVVLVAAAGEGIYFAGLDIGLLHWLGWH